MQQQAIANQYAVYENHYRATGDNYYLQRAHELKASSTSAAQRLEQVEQLMSAGLIDPEKAKDLLNMSTYATSNSVTIKTSGANQDKVRDGVGVSISASDLKNNPNCTNCYGSSTTHVGEVNVAGHIHDLYNCDSCRTVFTRQQGGLRNLVDKVAEAAGVSTGEVSVVIGDGTSQQLITDGTSSYATTANIDLSGQTINMQNYSLEQEARNQTQEIRNLKYEVTNLLQVMREIVDQNHRLQEKLATDPLVGLRDRINRFEIK
jgi:hypothetical protein